jgi:hypothetical protein
MAKRYPEWRTEYEQIYSANGTLTEFLKELLEKVPSGMSHDDIEVETGGDYDNGHEFNISWLRPQTEREAQSLKTSEEFQKNVRKKQYEALKKEFDGE